MLTSKMIQERYDALMLEKDLLEVLIHEKEMSIMQKKLRALDDEMSMLEQQLIL